MRRFGVKITGLSRAQVTRLIGRWMKHRHIEKRPAQRPLCTALYGRRRGAAGRDRYAHEDLSGPAIRHILHREFVVYRKAAYERLAKISVSHLYNLRHSERYCRCRVRVQHTRARQVSIGERRKPDGPQAGLVTYARTTGRPARKFSYQRRGHGDAMASGRMHGNHLRAGLGSRC